MFKNVVFYFVALLVILIIGFWKSYFSKITGDVSFGQHFHGIMMLLWVLLLISQAWLMRTRKIKHHRALGKASFVLAPLVVVSGLYVNFDSISGAVPPYNHTMLSFYWLGWASMLIFPMVYGLAIYHRKTAALHSRYMISTALVFLIPGLSRAISSIFPSIGLPVPDFITILSIPALIGLLLIYQEWRKGKILPPFVVFTGAWIITVIMFDAAPRFSWWHDFTSWSIAMVY